MTREEAVAIIRKEYLCVDRDCDIERSCSKCDLVMPSKEPILEAYKMAINALENQCLGKGIDCEDYPANEPKTNIGYWVKEDDIITHCSECGQRIMTCQDWFEYCPKCGTRMTDKGGTR